MIEKLTGVNQLSISVDLRDSMNNLVEIANQFDFPSEVKDIAAHGSGIINDTYVVTFGTTAGEHARLGRRAIMQRINQEGFPNPDHIMQNLALVLEHATGKSPGKNAEFILPPIYRTRQNTLCARDDLGNYWRAIGFIDDTETFDVLNSTDQAREVGAALGSFHMLLNDLPRDKLQDTLPGFHDTPLYLCQYDTARSTSLQFPAENVNEQNQSSPFPDTEQVAWSREHCFEQIESRRSLAGLLYEAQPEARIGVMHGDPKLNNFLFDKSSGRAVSLIDLDTIKSGYIHYDLGDCIRSCCNVVGEMPARFDDVQFSLAKFEAILSGYLSQASDFLGKHEYDLLYDVVRLLPFELGLRFFTDYLNNNQYFKVQSPDDNLYRARVQFQLLAEIENQEQSIKQLIASYANL